MVSSLELPASRRAEILVVGREILQGRTVDTNSNWLARRLTDSGWRVARVVSVDDRVEEIAEALREAIGRGNRLVICTGGLGPTSDDLTLQGIAEGAGVGLAPDDGALAALRDCYARLASQGAVQSAELTPERRKMALLPVGGEPLWNPVGAAPGCFLRAGGTTVVCLPGVPAEMKGMFDGHAAPRLEGLLEAGRFAEESLDVGMSDESALSPLLDRLRAEFPDLQVKSHAAHFGRGVRLRVVISGWGGDDEAIRKRALHAAARLRGLVEGAL